jgi:hypothetical protein
MENRNLLIGIAIGLVVGAGGGYWVGSALSAGRYAEVQRAQTASPAEQNAQGTTANALGNVQTNPYENVKTNPFDY